MAGPSTSKKRRRKDSAAAAASGVVSEDPGGAGKRGKKVKKKKKKRKKGESEREEDVKMYNELRGELVEFIPAIMYGFGDEKETLQESAELLESMALEFIAETVQATNDVISGKMHLQERILFTIRNDDKKYARARQMLENRKVIDSSKSRADDGILERKLRKGRKRKK